MEKYFNNTYTDKRKKSEKLRIGVDWYSLGTQLTGQCFINKIKLFDIIVYKKVHPNHVSSFKFMIYYITLLLFMVYKIFDETF